MYIYEREFNEQIIKIFEKTNIDLYIDICKQISTLLYILYIILEYIYIPIQLLIF